MSDRENIKNLLIDFEAEPSPAVWSSLQTDLIRDRKQKRRKLIVIFFLSCITAGGAAGWLWNSSAGRLKPAYLLNPADEKTVSPPLHGVASEVNATATLNLREENKITTTDKKSKEIFFIDVSAAARKKNELLHNRVFRSKPITAGTENVVQNSFSGMIHTQGRENGSPEMIASLSSPPWLQFTLPVWPSQLTGRLVTGEQKSASRWQLGMYFAMGNSYRHYHSQAPDATDARDLNKNEKAARAFETGMKVMYDFIPHFAIRSGAGYYTSGVEGNYSTITVSGAADNQQYNFNSSLGEIAGSGSELNRIFFNDPVASLLPAQGAGTGVAIVTNEVYKEFSFREQFEFISVPVSIIYKATEKRFTPYASVGASINYLAASTFYVNEKRIHYSFVEEPEQWSVSTLAFLGVSYKVSKHFSVQAEPSVRYSLTSLASRKETTWRPYSWFASLNLNYRF
jgi:hypothetical protein